MSIRVKLMSGFLLIVALIIVLSYASYSSLGDMARSADELEEMAEYLENAADVQVTAMDTLMPVNDYLITGDKGLKNKFDESISEVKKLIVELEEHADHDTEKQLIDEAKVVLDELEDDGNNVFTMEMEAIDNAVAIDAMGEFDETGERLELKIEELHEILGQEMRNTVEIVNDTESNSNKLLILLSAIAVGGGVAIGILLSRAITRPLNEVVELAKAVSGGDLSRKVEVKSKDELGDLADAINAMVDNLSEMIGNIGRSASQVASASDEMKSSSQQINKGAQTQASAAEETSSSMEEMAASIQTVAQNSNDLAANADETSATINQMVASIEQVARNTDNMATAVEETSSTVEQMAASIDKVASDTEAMASSVEETSATIEQMVASIDEVAKNSDSLALTVSDTSATIEEMAASINQVAKNVKQATDLSKTAAEDAKAGSDAVEQVVEGINNISTSMDMVTEVIGNLGKRSEEIGKIVEVIEEIADQTNLLALNAAIEAARAGEAGRGFAVVADEVRKLAERSVVATKEIGQVIRQVQNETTQAVKNTESGAAETREGIVLADKAGQALKRILHSFGATSSILGEIATATEQQTQSARKVLGTVENMNHATGQVINAVKEQSMGTNQIRQAVMNMNEITAQVTNAMKEQAAGGKQIRIAVEDMNRVTGQVSTATKEQAAGSAQIVKAVENMNQMTQQVANATAEQKRSGELVVKAVENISDIARDNLTAIEQMDRTADDLATQAEAMQLEVSKFRLHKSIAAGGTTAHCWEVLDCVTENRLKCPAYKSDEERCWLIDGTWCKGVKQGDAKSKLANCMHCEAFKVIQGHGGLPAKRSSAVSSRKQ